MTMSEQIETPLDPVHQAAFQLIMHIEARLAYGSPIYDRLGQKLDELDQVIEALLRGRIDEATIINPGSQSYDR